MHALLANQSNQDSSLALDLEYKQEDMFYYKPQFDKLKNNAIESSVSVLGITNPYLRKHLVDELSRQDADNQGVMGSPVFDSMFPWQGQPKSLEQLAGNLLHQRTIEAISDSEYKISVPYHHQITSWQYLADEKNPQSLVVTSGTGSGKTECFMVPVLDDLVREQDELNVQLEGVRALFLYPLNALINSQQKRLSEWTKPFNGDIRFCLYNGNTSERISYKKVPQEVDTREKLRNSPPPILVTNATMLEYMLIRQKDQPIIQKSQGKLRWVVLDEAHSYIGSTGAELSLLLRRVMIAFDVKPEQIRFIATSATIGDDDKAKQDLTNYLAKLAGVDSQQIHIISAQRDIPSLTTSHQINSDSTEPQSLQQICQIEPENIVSKSRFEALTSSPFARCLRQLFFNYDIDNNVTTTAYSLDEIITKIEQVLPQSLADYSQLKDKYDFILRWLDVCAYTKSEEASAAFLPLRGHFFQRTLSGLYSCINPICSGKAQSALAPSTSIGAADDWPFGYVFTTERQKCAHCSYPVYELTHCQDCQTPHLLAQFSRQITPEGATKVLTHYHCDNEEDFRLQTDFREVQSEDSDTAGDQALLPDREAVSRYPVVVLPRRLTQTALGDDPHKIELVYIDSRGRCITRRADHDKALEVSIRSDSEEASSTHACTYCEYSSRKQSVLKSAYLGGPFYMSLAAPTLLDYCKPSEEGADSLPYEGRQMITFTDSRQGTARIAMKIRQDSERKSLRHKVYFALAEALIEVDEVQKEAVITKIRNLKNVIETLSNDADNEDAISVLQNNIQEEEEKLAGGSAPIISWQEIIKKLKEHRDFTHLASSINRICAINGIDNDSDKAEILLLTEFASRPRNANSLENLGMVSLIYPKLKEINIAGFDLWKSLNLSREDWQDFLKLILDFYVRDGKYLNISWDKIACIPNRFLSNRSLTKPKADLNFSQADAKYIKSWTLVNQKNPNNSIKPIRLLALATNLDLESFADCNKINDIMIQAWKDLTNGEHKLLVSNVPNLYQLDFKSTAFTLSSQVWHCPITNNFLDSTFRQLTPYIPRSQSINELKANKSKYQCKSTHIPVFKQSSDSGSDYKSQAEQWLTTNTDIQRLRHSNQWTDLNSSVVVGMKSIVSEEHSAQIQAETLQSYEESFIKGKVNILNCSTTMEMGVDIGGISTVAMNNVPPHPANYLQRTGRAGRRQESKAMALTMCKNNPHEQMVFSQTDWAFRTKVATPYITLDSEKIIQRHINAYLLAQFLNHEYSDLNSSAVSLQSGWFFVGFENKRRDEISAHLKSLRGNNADRFIDANSPYKQMLKWLENLKLQENSELKKTVKAGMLALTRESALASKIHDELIISCHNAMKKLETTYISALKGLVEEYLKLDLNKNKVGLKGYQYKLIIDIEAMMSTYLLADLARYGFLPRYGFPAGLVTFDPHNRHVFDDKKPEKSGTTINREDNLSLKNDKPVRDVSIAIREFAPGNEVVLNGLVYKSEGLLLSHYMSNRNDDSDSKDAQIIKTFWRCKSCGIMGETYKAGDNENIECTGCQKSIFMADCYDFIEPMGFRADYFVKPHNDVSYQQYIDVEEPIIQANTQSKPLFSKVLGDYRSDNDGAVFHHSKGLSGHGYFVCLCCGRAESNKYDPYEQTISFNKQKEKFVTKHKPLKPIKGFKTEVDADKDKIAGLCSREYKGNQIVKHVSIGATDTTNILELLLKDPETGFRHYFPQKEQSTEQSSKDKLLTLAVVIRDAMASCHGINQDELGFGTKHVEMNNKKSEIIFIYDKASGGAGFASADSCDLLEVFKRAEQMLYCPNDCESVCHSCLLNYDTRFISDKLDRKLALEYFKDIRDGLELPAEYQYFKGAEYGGQEVETKVTTAFQQGFNHIHLYLTGTGNEWNLGAALNNKAITWSRNNNRLNISLPEDQIANLSTMHKRHLNFLSELKGVTLSSYGDSKHTLVQLTKPDTDEVVTLASSQSSAYIPNDEEFWVFANDSLVIESSEAELIPTQTLTADCFKLANNDSKKIEIKRDLDGYFAEFGNKFWQRLLESENLKNKIDSQIGIKAITYEDRYVRAPSVVLCLTKVIEELARLTSSNFSEISLNIKTLKHHRGTKFKVPNVNNNWYEENKKQTTIKKFMIEFLKILDISIETIDDINHQRTLLIQWMDSSVTEINIDHGFGFIKLYKIHCNEEEIDDLSNMEHYEFGDDIKAMKEDLKRIHDSKTTTVYQSKNSLKGVSIR